VRHRRVALGERRDAAQKAGCFTSFVASLYGSFPIDSKPFISCSRACGESNGSSAVPGAPPSMPASRYATMFEAWQCRHEPDCGRSVTRFVIRWSSSMYAWPCRLLKSIANAYPAKIVFRRGSSSSRLFGMPSLPAPPYFVEYFSAVRM
jgi:hypothetical protein